MSAHRSCSGPGAGRSAGRGELGASAIGPRPGVEALERGDRGAELLTREDAVARSAKTLTVGQLGARRLKPIGGALVLAQRPFEQLRSVGVTRDQRPTAERASDRPRLPLRFGSGGELVRQLLRIGSASQPEISVDEIWPGDRSASVIWSSRSRRRWSSKRSTACATSPSPSSSSPSAAVAQISCNLVPRPGLSSSASAAHARHSGSRPRRACSQASPLRANTNAVC